MDTFLTILFYTITNLQGSQTRFVTFDEAIEFYTITNLQGSQTGLPAPRRAPCFTPLQTYKVLKRSSLVLAKIQVLHHYKLTRFSNISQGQKCHKKVLHHYKLTRFSNNLHPPRTILYCFTPLQTYKVLKRA